MTEGRPDPADLLPLKADAFTILLRLLEGDAHGYAFLQAAEDRDGPRGHLQPGSLYRLLREMLAAELVERLEPERAPDGGDERRRYYRITDFGRRVAAAESRRMQELLRVARGLELLEKGDSA